NERNGVATPIGLPSIAPGTSGVRSRAMRRRLLIISMACRGIKKPRALTPTLLNSHNTRRYGAPDIAMGERPQGVVPAGHWQAAESLGDWTLASCTVAPGFEFSGFEVAPRDWEPGG